MSRLIDADALMETFPILYKANRSIAPDTAISNVQEGVCSAYLSAIEVVQVAPMRTGSALMGRGERMNNKEEVIEGLKKVWDAFDHMEHEMYADYVSDALALLKEQEVLEKRNEPIEPIKPEELWICGACGEGTVGWDDWTDDDTRYNYCPICGQAVKWE